MRYYNVYEACEFVKYYGFAQSKGGIVNFFKEFKTRQPKFIEWGRANAVEGEYPKYVSKQGDRLSKEYVP